MNLAQFDYAATKPSGQLPTSRMSRSDFWALRNWTVNYTSWRSMLLKPQREELGGALLEITARHAKSQGFRSLTMSQ